MSPEELADRYLKGESAVSLAKLLNLNTQTILNRLRKAGVVIRTRGGRFTHEEVEAIAREYESGLSTVAIAKKYDLSPSGVNLIARRYGKTVRSNKDYKQPRKHHFREDFFQEWSPDMAYVLGLITTDGNVHDNTLRIYQKEVALLDQLRPVLQAEMPYQMTGDGTIYTLRLNSKLMMRDLESLGVHPNKSLTIRAPKEVPFPQDYIRGIFDGDGHGGYYRKRTKRVLRIGFTSGSKEFLEDLKLLLPMPIGGPYEHRGHGKYAERRYWVLQTSSEKQARILREWMYSGDSSIHSKRKRVRLFDETSLVST